jgi:hypothetical protein
VGWLGVFIAPTTKLAVWWWLTVVWCTGQSGAHQTCPMRQPRHQGRWVPTVGALFSGPAWMSGGTPDMYYRVSGVPARACLTSACFWRALNAPAGDRCREVAVAPLAHQTVRCTLDSPVNYSGANSRSWRVPEALFLGTPDSPVNYSGAPLDFPEGEVFSAKSPGAPDTVQWHTGQSGAPDQGTLRLSLCSFIEPNTWSFYWLSVNLWHLYNLYT